MSLAVAAVLLGNACGLKGWVQRVSARVCGSCREVVVVRRFTEAERTEVWDRWQRGEAMRSIARRLGRQWSSVRTMIEDTGGVRPMPRRRSSRCLSLTEREEISRGVAAGESLRAIAHRMGRAPSTVCREVGRNGGRTGYRALGADRAAWRRARRAKPAKLAANTELRVVVEDKLAQWWSPHIPFR